MANHGNGSTWPGHIALSINKHFIKDILATNDQGPASPDASQGGLKTILVVGTNGKTTTSLMIQTILQTDKKRVLLNNSGANLLNGIASTLLLNSNLSGKLPYDYAIFEIDENTLPLVLKQLTPHYIVVLNLFRDQLDRYGEVNSIAKKWHTAMHKLPSSTTLLLNADDPQIAYLGFSPSVIANEVKQSQTEKIALSPLAPRNDKPNVFYFGLDDKKLGTSSSQHAADSTYCPNCGKKLVFSTTYYAHLGQWHCASCKYTQPRLSLATAPAYPLFGVYNR